MAMRENYLMFRSRRTGYRKSNQVLPWPLLLPAIPLGLLILELFTRLVVGVAGKSVELEAYQGAGESPTAYTLKFLGKTKRPYDGLSDRGGLAVQRQAGVGYSLVGNQESKFWRINEQGFRDDNPVPLEKPKNEIRIFLVGGTTAFGQGNANNQATLASKLEARLNARVVQQKRTPEKYRPQVLPFYKPEVEKALNLPLPLKDAKYRVINAAVPGYSSGNEVAQVALQLLPYKPDAIVALNGYTDLMLPSDQQQRDIPQIENFLDNAPGHFWTHLTQQFNYAVTNTYLYKATQAWILKPQPSVSKTTLVATESTAPLAEQLPVDAAELERRTTRYRDRLTQMATLTKGAKIPLVIGLQPEITGRSQAKLSSPEKALLKELGPKYKERVETGYGKLAQVSQQLQEAFPKNVKTLNFYKLDEDFSKGGFTDAIHLSEEANTVLAERIYRTLTGLSNLQVTPPKIPE
jgi:lysophospholipase L1-like esterase